MHLVAYALLALAATCYLSDWLLSLWDGPGAPPRARARVPLIGHALGLYKLGGSYYTKVRFVFINGCSDLLFADIPSSAQQSSEIYTLGIFTFKIYVVNSRHLIPLVQRLSKTLSFAPFMQVAAKAFVDCSKYTVDLHANPDFTRDLSRAMKDSLSPGPHLDYQNLRATNSLKDVIDKSFSRSSASNSSRLRLHEWVKHVITIAASNGVYGTSNPFLDAQVEHAFWYATSKPSLIIVLTQRSVGHGLMARRL